MKRLIVLLGVCVPLCAQIPFVTPRGVVNAASFVPGGLPNAALAQGSMFTLFGKNIGPATPAQATSFPLQPALAGVSIKVRQGTVSVDALPVFVSAGQINAILPSNSPTGRVLLQVTYNGQKSNSAPVSVVRASFGAFSVVGGVGPGIFQNFVSPEQQPINSLEQSAQPGQVATLWGTGLGPGLNADNGPPQPGDLPTPVTVLVGGRTARKLYSGRSPCCASIDQIVFEIPSDAPSGCWVPVQVIAGGVVSNTVTMAISANGGRCTEPANPLAERLRQGGRIGVAAVLRSSVVHNYGLAQPSRVVSDSVIATVREERGSPFAFNSLFSLPPAGSCTAYAATGDLFHGAALPASAATGRYLNAGTGMTIIGPRGGRTLSYPRDLRMGVGILGSSVEGSPVAPNLFVEPGDFTISTSGGSDVSRLSVTTTVSREINWTNAGEVVEIDRSKPLTLNWSGGPPGVPTLLTGTAVDRLKNASGMFLCVAPAGTATFSVPPAAMANLPRGRGKAKSVNGLISIGPLALPQGGASGSGLDLSLGIGLTFTGKTVAFY